jgi:hypothetical protein
LEQVLQYILQEIRELLQHIEAETGEDIQMEVALVDPVVANQVDNLLRHLLEQLHMLDKEMPVEHDQVQHLRMQEINILPVVAAEPAE